MDMAGYIQGARVAQALSFGGELGWPSFGPNRLGRSVYGPYPPLIVMVSPCRCEPLRAGCCGGEGVFGVS